MNPVEVLTSESQERMLAIVTPENLDEVLALCERWEIRATVVGRVTDTGAVPRLRRATSTRSACPARTRRRRSATTPPEVSSDRDADRRRPDRQPRRRPALPPPARAARRPRRAAGRTIPRPSCCARFPPGTDLAGELLALLASPNIADKSWVWRQYDHQLFLNTVVGPGRRRQRAAPQGDRRKRARALGRRQGPVLRARPARRRRSSRCSRPRATSRAPARAPMALVNCLNFGNPEHPEVMWQFSEVVDGMSEACSALGMPVVGGNVSFYNESHGADIDPTPVVGVIGLIDELDSPPPGHRPARRRPHRACSARPRRRARRLGVGDAPRPARRRARRPPTSRRAGCCTSSSPGSSPTGWSSGLHDCSDGGLAVALAEMAIRGRRRLPRRRSATPAMCFSESASRVVLSVAPDAAERGARPGQLRPRSRPWSLGDAGGADLRADGAFTVAARRRRRTPGATPSLRSWEQPLTWDNEDVSAVTASICGDPPAERDPWPRLWRLRHLRPRPGRRPADLPRAVRAAAPRPGVGRHRGERRRDDHRRQGHGPRHPGLRRAPARPAAGPPRDRPQPLLDHRVVVVAERAAGVPVGRRRRLLARPQRQPHEHRRARGRRSACCRA